MASIVEGDEVLLAHDAVEGVVRILIGIPPLVVKFPLPLFSFGGAAAGFQPSTIFAKFLVPTQGLPNALQQQRLPRIARDQVRVVWFTCSELE